MSSALKVLIVFTSHASLGTSEEKTGLWLEEFTTPYYVFADAGAQIDVVSIQGGAAPIDPRSLNAAGEKPASVERYLRDADLRGVMQSTLPVASVAKDRYDIVFLPGGHGTMWDLPQSAALAKLVADTLRAGRVVGAVCHGPAGLVASRYADGRSILAGRRVTGFTNSEEDAVGLTKVVPFLLESRMRELGARFEAAPNFQSFAIADGNLVTGQNPASSARAAELALAAAAVPRKTAM
jgi:putative intracellular protease/amidase